MISDSARSRPTKPCPAPGTITPVNDGARIALRRKASITA
jgi:hypothetical protein